jgi:hypothetical protein
MREEILKLGNAECYTVPESDYGKAEIWKINELYFLFSIPMFGGMPQYEGKYSLSEIDEMIKEIVSWT